MKKKNTSQKIESQWNKTYSLNLGSGLDSTVTVQTFGDILRLLDGKNMLSKRGKQVLKFWDQMFQKSCTEWTWEAK